MRIPLSSKDKARLIIGLILPVAAIVAIIFFYVPFSYKAITYQGNCKEHTSLASFASCIYNCSGTKAYRFFLLPILVSAFVCLGAGLIAPFIVTFVNKDGVKKFGAIIYGILAFCGVLIAGLIWLVWILNNDIGCFLDPNSNFYVMIEFAAAGGAIVVLSIVSMILSVKRKIDYEAIEAAREAKEARRMELEEARRTAKAAQLAIKAREKAEREARAEEEVAPVTPSAVEEAPAPAPAPVDARAVALKRLAALRREAKAAEPAEAAPAPAAPSNDEELELVKKELESLKASIESLKVEVAAKDTEIAFLKEAQEPKGPQVNKIAVARLKRRYYDGRISKEVLLAALKSLEK